VDLAEVLRQSLDGEDAAWILANRLDLQGGIDLMTARVWERQSLLK